MSKLQGRQAVTFTHVDPLNCSWLSREYHTAAYSTNQLSLVNACAADCSEQLWLTETIMD